LVGGRDMDVGRTELGVAAGLEEPKPGLVGQLRVLVVGAGVSGCACASTIAEAGYDVTIMNSALDVVGLPSFGPDVCVGEDSIARALSVFDELPALLREVWVDACVVPEEGPGRVAVDRRRVSIETKRALEGMPGLRFRQGLVVDLEVVPGRKRPRDDGGPGSVAATGQASDRGHARLTTAFGETVDADAVILAPGLSLGGRVAMGGYELPGGRYGETPPDGLYEALTRLGAELEPVGADVGSRYGRAGLCAVGMVQPDGVTDLAHARESIQGTPARPIALRRVVGRERLAEVTGGGGARNSEVGSENAAPTWSDEYPPSPYWSAKVHSQPFWLGPTESGEMGATMDPSGRGWAIWPDGLATGEAYVAPGGDGPTEALNVLTPSRIGHSVRGWTISSLERDGRLSRATAEPVDVWVAGRAAGCRDYLESLRSGTTVGKAVVRRLEHGRGVLESGDGAEG
jgi:hypothetical protein